MERKREMKMKTLPNGVKIYNATPHVIRFWRKGWPNPIEVEPDRVVSARVVETEVHPRNIAEDVLRGMEDSSVVRFVRVEFMGNDDGLSIIQAAQDVGAMVVGSIIAAQAYPGVVFAMTPAPGYERVPPAEKRMNPDKFTVY
jgi:hypothetical protein